MAIKWYLINVKEMENFKIKLAKIKHTILPMVTIDEFKKMLNYSQKCYMRKAKGKSNCNHAGC